MTEHKQAGYAGTYTPADDEIDLIELVKTLWQGKWTIIGVTFVFAVASVLYALSQPNVYKADAVLAPAESGGGNSMSKLAAQYGGIASLAGVNLGVGEISTTDLALKIIKSRQFITEFIEKHQLLVPLMALKEWDAENNKIILDEEVYDAETNTWLREPKGLRGATPTAQEAYEVFTKDHLNVSSDTKSGFHTVSITHRSPYVAQQWVAWLIDDINQMMRERSIEEAENNLAYLNEQLEKTAIANMQTALYNLIEEQTKSLMLAQAQNEFAFKVVDPAVVPEVKSGPKRALICIVGTLAGGMLGVMLVLVISVVRQEASKDKA